MKNKKYRKAHEELAPEYELARAVIDARVTAGLTQEQLAQRMDTTQSVIARLESGRTHPLPKPLSVWPWQPERALKSASSARERALDGIVGLNLNASSDIVATGMNAPKNVLVHIAIR